MNQPITVEDCTHSNQSDGVTISAPDTLKAHSANTQKTECGVVA
uniref:Uncharacterized protein n=1 Tax=Anguilla anguilla TaxID=7936 RepID=A0A0E9SB81_ANGAN